MLKRKLKPERLNDISIDVPVDWEIRKLEEVAREVSERGGTSAIPVLSMTKYDGFVPSLEYFKKRIFSRSTHNYKVVKKGQFAYSTIHLDEGAIGLLQEFEIGLISPMYTVFEADTSIIDLSFFEYKLSHDETIRIYGQLGQGSVDRRKSISFDKFKNIQIALPPILEQQHIAVILSSLDALIQISSQVLKQLETVKRGMMQQLLTRGKEKKLSEIVIKNGLQTGPFGSQLKASEYTETGVPVVMPQNIKNTFIDEKIIARVSHQVTERLEKHQLQSGDILFSRRGDLSKIALIQKNQTGWLCGTGCLRARLDKSVNPAYLILFLQQTEVISWLQENAVGQTMPNLNTSILGLLPLRIPTLEEQQRIVTILSSFDARIRLEKDYKTSLETLKKGLMQQLLSGKLDAREITILEGKT
jgi:type I restriction enzyme, S subunit